MTSRPSTAAPILAVLAIVLVTLGAYVGAYFWAGETVGLTGGFTSGTPDAFAYKRIYPYRWQASLFHPASMLDAWLCGVSISTIDRITWDTPAYPTSPKYPVSDPDEDSAPQLERELQPPDLEL
jgi:hypothetical protein